MPDKDRTRIEPIWNTVLPREGEGASAEAPSAGTTEQVPPKTPCPRKGEFLANVSREIRTPFYAIMAVAEALPNTEPSMENRTSVRLLRTSAEALLDAVDKRLDFSLLAARQDELTCEVFDLEQLVSDLFRTLDVTAPGVGWRLRFEIRRDVPVLLKGDARRLRQVVMVLVANAIKFAPVGQVSMTVSVAKRSPGGVTLHFAVSDTGIGISKDRQSAILEPFVSVDESTARTYGGTGLGLRIAAQLVTLMEGEIWVEGAVDQGSLFHFTRSSVQQGPPRR